MLSIKRDTVDSLSTLGEDWSRRESVQSNPVLVLPYRYDPRTSDLNATALSPPPAPGSPKAQQPHKLHLRLRSDSGLDLHTNKAAFRQYTDYNSDGSLRSQTSRARPLSFDGVSNIDTISIGKRCSADLREPLHQNRPIPNFFGREVIKMAFCDPTTGQRLCQFAQSRHSAADVEFLLKVGIFQARFTPSSLFRHANGRENTRWMSTPMSLGA
jgi:phototropin